MTTKLKSGQTILFIGDSITDCGRRGAERPLGNGYVKLFADLLTIREPRKKIKIINKGISGDRVTGLRQRWSDDVSPHKPNWLSVKIGINDLHSFLRNAPDAVTLKIFEESYDYILSQTTKQSPECGVLLIDPFYMSVEKSKNLFRREVLDLLPEYIAVVHAMSAKYQTRLIKTHEMFQSLLRHNDTESFGNEPIHPHATGHLAIAEAVYAALS